MGLSFTIGNMAEYKKKTKKKKTKTLNQFHSIKKWY